MKNSGVAWLGEVPAVWTVQTFRRVASLESGRDFKTQEVLEGGFPVIGSGGEFARADGYLFDGESVLLGRKGTIDKPLYVNTPFWTVDTMYYSRVIQSVVTKFVYYWATILPFKMFATNTAVPSMTSTDIKNFQIALPPFEEQVAIASFLDRETAQIDELIDKQQQLIATLAERRKAVITRAVTRGLDENAGTKPSELYWAPLMPETWVVDRLARHFSASKGKNAAVLTKEYCGEIPGDFPVYSGQTSNDGVMAYIASFEFDSGDEGVLLSTTVGSGLVMTLKHIRGKFSLSQNCMVISRRGNLSTSFYRWQLSAMFDAKRGELSGDMQTSFRMSDLYSYKILRPSLPEQRQIAQFLDSETRQIDLLAEKTETMISLLIERRQALISAAVTGKIDVSGEGL
ncbi:MAG: restriction endonuclease subunit S [Actinomycetales bacterium]|nr:restriction endonuclease subunit S [Actinomycetales bacterium]